MNNIQLFESKKILSQWDAEQEKQFFSIVDIIEVLTDSERPRKQWTNLKAKLIKDGSGLSEKIGQLKLTADYGKLQATKQKVTESKKYIL